MLQFLEVFSILLLALAMAPALAHALEFPGKSRLNRDEYLAVQPIYYPGFTVAGGIGEVGGLVSVIALLLVTPRGTVAFWSTVLAVAGLFGMELIFWLFTQPLNKVWLESTSLGHLGTAFFSSSPADRQSRYNNRPTDWRAMRDTWEYSHICRAGLASLSFFALVVAAVFRS
jgi:hypothetical protein